MSNEPPSGPLVTVIAITVIAITGLVMWSTGNLFSARAEPSSSLLVPPPARSSVPAQSEDDASTNASDGAAAGVGSSAKPDPQMEKIKAMLKKGHAVPNEAMLTFKSKADLNGFLRDAAKLGLKVISVIDKLNTVRVGFADEKTLANYLTQAGSKAPAFESNQWLTVPTLPKSDASNQDGHEPVGEKLLASINALGDRTHWGDGVTVAVLDTGVLPHSTFGADQVTHVDLVNDGKEFHPHGTSVASLIGSQDDRVPGVAPGTHILDVRVANDKGISVSSVLAEALIMATDRHAQIINISMGSPATDQVREGYSEVLQQAVNYANAHQVFVVAAAGNDGLNQLSEPAVYSNVISVGAVDGANKQAYFSNSGTGLKFAAPGVGLITDWKTGTIASVSGTSQAAPVVSAVMAANYSHGTTYAQMLHQMQTDARATGAPRNQVGYGVVQVHR